MAGNIFLKIGDIKGECIEGSHKEWIDVDSYSEGLHSNQSASYGGGSSLGTATYEDFTVTCQLDLAIPTLMQACSTSQHFPTAKLHAIKMSNDSSWMYLEVTMSDVMVTGVHFNGSLNQIPHVQVSLAFSKIKTQYWTQDSKGGKGVSTEAAWDQKRNMRA